MKYKIQTALLATSIALASVALSNPAHSQTYIVASAGTDYVSRGTTQTFGDPAVTVYAEHQFKNGFYIAGFAANVDFDNQFVEDTFGDDGTVLEADAFAGYRGAAGSFNYDAGLALITYVGTKPTPGYNPSGNWNMVEAKMALSHAVGPATLTATVAVTPDYFNNYGPSVWTEVSGTVPLTKSLSASGAFGRQQFFEKSETGFPAGLSNYNTWNAGVSYALTPRLTADLRYFDNDTKINLGPIYKPRAVFTLKRSF